MTPEEAADGMLAKLHELPSALRAALPAWYTSRAIWVSYFKGQGAPANLDCVLRQIRASAEAQVRAALENL